MLGKDDDKLSRDPNDDGSNERSHADEREDQNEDGINDDDSSESSNSGKNQRVFNIQIKLREPPKFDGSKDVDVVDWAAQVKRYLCFVKRTHHETVGYIALLLEGHAAAWFDKRYITEKESLPSRPKDLLDEVIKQFESPLRSLEAWTQWGLMHQKEDEDVEQFALCYDLVCRKVGNLVDESIKL